VLAAVLTEAVIFLSPSWQILVEYHDQATTASFQIFSDSTVTSQITIDFCTSDALTSQDPSDGS
jgi:hypothetical protein